MTISTDLSNSNQIKPLMSTSSQSVNIYLREANKPAAKSEQTKNNELSTITIEWMCLRCRNVK